MSTAPRASGWLIAMLVAGLTGMAATVVQIVERITVAERPSTVLVCDLNDTFSCGAVITAPQSSVFGPVPNAAIGLVVFTIMMFMSLAGLLGTRWSPATFGVVAFLATFMAGFTVWFLAQTAFVIERVCLWCLFIGASVLVVNASVWRIGFVDGRLDGGSAAARAGHWLVRGGTDLVLWAGLGAMVAVMMFVGLSG